MFALRMENEERVSQDACVPSAGLGPGPALLRDVGPKTLYDHGRTSRIGSYVSG